jgi:hypothetical protein
MKYPELTARAQSKANLCMLGLWRKREQGPRNVQLSGRAARRQQEREQRRQRR